ncbi:MAG TPA: FHA domain-containing protein, partial [Chloroflexia bacterium]|nr:FHA domain-containing protein [Chloroflexia bacterium]
QSSDSAYAPTGGMTSGDLQTGTADSGDLQDTWQYPTGGTQDQHPSGDIQSADPTAAAASAAPSVSPMASHASEVTPVTEDTMVDAMAAGDDAGESTGTQEQTYTYVPDTSGATGAEDAADTQQEGSPMPDVVPIAAEAPPAYPGISPAAAGTPVDPTMEAAGSNYAHDASRSTSADAGGGGGGGGGGGAWASSALAQLDEAQQALAGGDWARFGQSMAALRSMLENAGQGSATEGGAGATYAPAGPGTDDGATAGTGISAASSPAADMSAYTSQAADTGTADTASSGGAGYEWSSTGADNSASTGAGQSQESAIPAVEPAAEAGTLGAATADSAATYDAALGGAGASASPDASYGDGSGNGAVASGDMETGVGAGAATSADAGVDAGAATIAPATGATAGAASMLARLVVISTGAELPLPDQEEITVGREDPSSGIFPDVDLTPYGGEEGGVSRRHARILFIEDEYYVEDLQSTNYTKVDGQRLPAHIRERVEDGARIDFGRVAVIFRRS